MKKVVRIAVSQEEMEVRMSEDLSPKDENLVRLEY